jgi:hypothetical protein
LADSGKIISANMDKTFKSNLFADDHVTSSATHQLQIVTNSYNLEISTERKQRFWLLKANAQLDQNLQ